MRSRPIRCSPSGPPESTSPRPDRGSCSSPHPVVGLVAVGQPPVAGIAGVPGRKSCALPIEGSRFGAVSLAAGCAIACSTAPYSGLRARNCPRVISGIRVFSFALITQLWRILQHITASPSSPATSPAPRSPLTHLEHGYIN